MAGEIFISYRRADAAWARRLHALLHAEGVEAWYDAHVGPGQDWRIATAQALEASSIFVLLFSANAADSTDIAKELAAATLEKKLIIPVRLENIAPKGAFLYELASRNWVNAYENTEATLAELAKGLARLVKTGGRDDGLLPFDRAGAGKTKRRTFWRAGAAAVLLSACAVAAWFFWPKPQWSVTSSRPFISTLALEDFPAFSPSGTMLAYSSGAEGESRHIYVRNLAAGEGTRVSDDTYDDTSPSWSSDGVRLAYIAIKRGEPCRIMVTTFPTGQAREVGRCSLAQGSAISWQPGTSVIYGIESGGLKGARIFRLNLDTGSREVIVAEAALRDTISSLYCSPDGKWLTYLLRGQAIIVRNLTNGQERQLGEISTRGDWNTYLAWTQDSRTVLTSIAGRVGGSEIKAYPLNGDASYSVYATATRLGNFATGGGLLAMETDISRSGLARAGAQPAAQPDLMDPANGLTWSPSFAPDGTLAFLSNRSGTNALWLMKRGAAPRVLFDAALAHLWRAQFSPDGALLLVASETTHAGNIRIITRAGATVTTFDMPSLGLGLPNWTPDGKAVLVFDRRLLRTVQVPIAQPALAKPFAAQHWVGVAVRRDGIFATRADKSGIWRIDGTARQINALYPPYYYPPLAFRGDDVLVPDFTQSDHPRILAQPVSGGASRAVAYAPGAINLPGFQADLAVDPVGGAIIYSAMVQHDTNIDLLTLTRR